MINQRNIVGEESKAHVNEDLPFPFFVLHVHFVIWFVLVSTADMNLKPKLWLCTEIRLSWVVGPGRESENELEIDRIFGRWLPLETGKKKVAFLVSPQIRHVYYV